MSLILNGSPDFRLLYLAVHDDEAAGGAVVPATPQPRYTRSMVKSALQLMGCKPRHADKVTERVFASLEGAVLRVKAASGGGEGPFVVEEDLGGGVVQTSAEGRILHLSRARFLAVAGAALADYQYGHPDQMEDLSIACRIKERKTCVTVLLCGTSGTGKSTLASLLASRLGISMVISTDSVRSLMRSFVGEEDNPLLWASTYHAGDHFEPAQVEGMTEKKRAVKAYKAQCEMVIEHLDRLIGIHEQRRESLIIEGVHLSLNFVVALMKRHPSVVPFLVFISNENKHKERFAVRAKYMAVDPAHNRYVKHIRNIRTIQDYLCKRADKHLIPKVDNTNVDRSVAAIHATVFSCLRVRSRGTSLVDPATDTARALHAEYMRQFTETAWSSKGMLEVIRRKHHDAGSSDTPSTSSSWNGSEANHTGGDGGDDDAASIYYELGGNGGIGEGASTEGEEGEASDEEQGSDEEGAAAPSEVASVCESHDDDDHQAAGGATADLAHRLLARSLEPIKEARDAQEGG